MNYLPHVSEWIRHGAWGSGPATLSAPRGRTQDAQRLKNSVWLNQPRTRWIIGCGVILLHVGILVFFTRISLRWSLPRESPSTLILLDQSPAIPKLTEMPISQQKSKSLVDDGRRERIQGNAAEDHESGQLNQTQQSEALFDWSAEVDTVAKAEAPELLADRRRKCHDAELHGKLLLGCRKAKTPDIWSSTGKGGLLSFGKRPEANGHIFDTMRDPDRDRSSVPDIAELQKVPRRPLPLAIDPRHDDFTH